MRPPKNRRAIRCFGLGYALHTAKQGVQHLPRCALQRLHAVERAHGFAADFFGRFETTKVGGGTISRSRCSPMVCTRTPTEVSRSDDECFYVLYVLSGYHACEQNGRKHAARAGEIIVVDSGQPCRVEGGGPYDIICVTVPKAQLQNIRHPEDKLANALLTGGPLATPLLSCASYIPKNLTTASPTELKALYDAWVSLLPLAGGCFDDVNKERLTGPQNSSLLRAIQEFVGRNIADSQLSAHRPLAHFGISVRYVHKLFACSGGTTFNAIRRGHAARQIRRDLLCPSWTGGMSRISPIAGGSTTCRPSTGRSGGAMDAPDPIPR